MSAIAEDTMIITIKDLELSRRERLRERLDLAAHLRCDEHGQSPVGVAIFGRENGWFDSRWTTCCDSLEKQAVAILKERC